jgi:L-alanine-DL-glutamate epimerase-like enolase superfamily enzyme
MKITEIDIAGQNIPIADDFPVSYESHTMTDHVFVRLHTDAGLTGYGEGTALPWFTGETTASMVAFVEEWLGPRVVGKELDAAAADIAAFAGSFPANPGAKAAVELALLDLRGKRAGAPVRELLGSTMNPEIPCVYPVPGLEPERAAEVTQDGLDAGFRRFKIKATGNIDADVARIDTVTDMLSGDATARVDPNTSWENFATAKRVIDQLTDPEKIEYFEQPVAPDRPEDLRQLWDATGIQMFADEFVHDLADVEQLGRDNLAAGIHLKLAKTGSLLTLAHLAETARHHDMKATPVSAFGTSLEVSAVLHLAATMPNIPTACELDPSLIAKDPSTEHITVEPTVTPPDGPGLGIELDDSVF